MFEIERFNAQTELFWVGMFFIYNLSNVHCEFLNANSNCVEFSFLNHPFIIIFLK